MSPGPLPILVPQPSDPVLPRCLLRPLVQECGILHIKIEATVHFTAWDVCKDVKAHVKEIVFPEFDVDHLPNGEEHSIFRKRNFISENHKMPQPLKFLSSLTRETC